MVMHARKVARLDDGYRDLNQPEILSKDKGLSNSHSTKYSDRKVSKFDSFDHRRRSNSPRSLHSRSGHYDNKPRERRNYEETDNSSKDSKTKEQKHKDHKHEVHRLAERVCGDWSEHISKSGKRYFYNCRTEVSQWEKPDCWIEENSSSVRSNEKILHDSSDRSKSSSSSKANSHVGDSRHSTSNNKLSSSSKPSRREGRDNRGTFREEQRSPIKNTSSSKDVGSVLRDRTSRQDRKRPYSRHSASRSPAHSQKSGKYGSRGSSSEAGSGGCYKNSSGKNDSSGNGGVCGRKREKGHIESVEVESSKPHVVAKETDSYKNSPVHEDMDISPDNSFSQTDVETRTSHDGLNSKSSPQTLAVTSTPSGTINISGSNGETAHLDRPSTQALPLSIQESSFYSSTSVTPSTVTPNSSSTWSGPNAVNPIQHQQQHHQSLQTTLAGLQQAVLRLVPDKVSTSVSGHQSQTSSQANFANCVALLPVLLAQLSSQQQAGSGSNNSDNQLIIQQAIPLLKKLQEIVVHQQQQQQQRKLQQVLFQLLQMQNSGSNVHANSSHKIPGNDKAESPYSPPDSDGSPVQTPSHNRHVLHHHNRQATPGNRQSPRQSHQELGHPPSASKQNRQEKMTLHQNSSEDADEKTDSAPFSASTHSRMEKSDTRPTMNSQLSSSSTGSQTPSHHPSIPFYRRNEIELTPGLINYFNSNAVEHVSNWHADSLVKQADCIAADNYSYLAPLCCQVSVELKQARSMVRAQEILSTRHEQRRIFIQHQLYELDRGLSVPSLFPPNPILMTFTQQQAATAAPPQVPPPQQATHQSSGQSTQPTHGPTPLSPQPASASVLPPADPVSPLPSQNVSPTPVPQNVSTSEVTPCESLNTDLT